MLAARQLFLTPVPIPFLFPVTLLLSYSYISVMDSWGKLSGQILLERYGMTELGMILSNSYRGKRLAGHVGIQFFKPFSLSLSLNKCFIYDRPPASLCDLPPDG